MKVTDDEIALLDACRALAGATGTVDLVQVGGLVRATYHSAAPFGMGQSTQDALTAARRRDPVRWEQSASTALDALRNLRDVLLRELPQEPPT